MAEKLLQRQYLLLKVMGKVTKYSSKCSIGLRDRKKQTKRTLRYISEFITLRVIFRSAFGLFGGVRIVCWTPSISFFEI